MAGVEAGQVGAVGGAQATTNTTATRGWTPENIFQTFVFYSNEMHFLLKLFILSTKAMLSHMDKIMTWDLGLK